MEDLTDLELAYAPPFGSAKDPVNIAGYVASNVLSGFHEIIGWRELRDILKSAPASIQLVDVRTPEEFSIQTLPGPAISSSTVCARDSANSIQAGLW